MDVKHEMERVLAIAKQLGVGDAASHESRVQRAFGRHEYVVVLSGPGGDGAVRIANFAVDEFEIEEQWCPSSGRLQDVLIADVVLADGPPGEIPAGFTTVRPIAKWAGVREAVANDMHDAMVRRSTRARRAANTRRVRNEALIKELPPIVTDAVLADPSRASEIIAAAATAQVGLSEHDLHRSVFDVLVARFGVVGAVSLELSGRLGQTVLERARSDVTRAMCDVLTGVAEPLAAEARRRMIWGLLEPFPRALRSEQWYLLQESERQVGSHRVVRGPWTLSISHLGILSAARSRAEASLLVLLSAEASGEDVLPWATVSWVQGRLATRSSGGGVPVVDEALTAPYPSTQAIREDVDEMFAWGHPRFEIAVSDVVVGESGGNAAGGNALGRVPMRSEWSGSPRQDASGVAKLALQMGVSEAVVHQTEIEGNESTREYMVEIRQAGRRGVVRVANFVDGDDHVEIVNRPVAWGGEGSIVDLRDRRALGTTGTLATAADAIVPIAEWAGLDDAAARTLLRAHRARRRDQVLTGERWKDVIASVADRIVGGTGLAAEALGDLGRIDPDVSRYTLHLEVARAVADRMGIHRALGQRFGSPLSEMLVRLAVMLSGDELRARLDAGDVPRSMDELRGAAWDMLREFPLAVRCQQVDVLDRAGVWLGRRPTPETARGARRAFASVLAGLRLADRAQMAAVALYRDMVPVDVPGWVWVSDMQATLSGFRRSAGWRVPDSLLIPYRDSEEIRDDIETASRSGQVLVPLRRPLSLRPDWDDDE